MIPGIQFHDILPDHTYQVYSNTHTLTAVELQAVQKLFTANSTHWHVPGTMCTR